MQTITKGLVLRATKTNESDRVLAILTLDHGIVSAMAKGALRLKNKLFSGTGLFCYSEFTLFQGKNMYIVDEAQVPVSYTHLDVYKRQLFSLCFLNEEE